MSASYAVMVDGWQLDRIFTGPSAAEDANGYASYCNRNYLGRHTVHPADDDSAQRFCNAIGVAAVEE